MSGRKGVTRAVEQFQAKLEHDESTIRALCALQHSLADRKRIVLGYIVAVAFLVLGAALAASSAIGILMVCVGCWAMVANGMTAERHAKDIISKLNGRFPVVHYRFLDDRIEADFGDNVDKIAYPQIQRLITDSRYGFIYLTSGSVYMFALDSAGNIDETKAFLSEHTGLNWDRHRKVLSFTVKDIVEWISALKRKKQSGEPV